jgi:PAS domain S-box-containing protein
MAAMNLFTRWITDNIALAIPYLLTGALIFLVWRLHPYLTQEFLGGILVVYLGIMGLNWYKKHQKTHQFPSTMEQSLQASESKVRSLLDQTFQFISLLESEEKYRMVFEGSAKGILIADVETQQIEFANLAISQMLGYTEGELKGLKMKSIHPQEFLGFILTVFNAIAKGEQIHSPPVPLLRKDGAVFHAEVSGTVVFLDGRKYCVGFFTDITERIQAEESLKKYTKQLEVERANLQAIFDASQVGMLMIDERGEITRINGVLTGLLNKNAADMLNQRPGEALCCINAKNVSAGCGHSKACIKCPLRKILEQVLRTGRKIHNVPIEQHFSMEEEKCCVWFSVSGSPVVVDGRRRVLFALTNITNPKRMEEAILRDEARQTAIIELHEKSELAPEEVGNSAGSVFLPTQSLAWLRFVASTLAQGKFAFVDLLRRTA